MSLGKSCVFTSVIYCWNASVISAYKSRYLRKNLGLNSCVIPIISCVTNTWPSTPPPAPIPITGIVKLFATSSANLAGTFSKTKAKQPSSSRSLASSFNFRASSSS